MLYVVNQAVEPINLWLTGKQNADLSLHEDCIYF
jgi:hypothetical protein